MRPAIIGNQVAGRLRELTLDLQSEREQQYAIQNEDHQEQHLAVDVNECGPNFYLRQLPLQAIESDETRRSIIHKQAS